MKNPAYEQIQTRKVKVKGAHAAACAAREWQRQSDLPFFGVWRALFYIWKHRYEKHGVGGLRDLPRRPHNIRFRIAPEIVSLIFAFGRSAVTAAFESVSIFNGINRRSRQHSKLVRTNHSCVRV